MRNIASVCLEIGYPTLASIPHSIINGYKRVLAVAVETDITFPLAEKVRIVFTLGSPSQLLGKRTYIQLVLQHYFCVFVMTLGTVIPVA